MQALRNGGHLAITSDFTATELAFGAEGVEFL